MYGVCSTDCAVVSTVNCSESCNHHSQFPMLWGVRVCIDLSPVYPALHTHCPVDGEQLPPLWHWHSCEQFFPKRPTGQGCPHTVPWKQHQHTTITHTVFSEAKTNNVYTLDKILKESWTEKPKFPWSSAEDQHLLLHCCLFSPPPPPPRFYITACLAPPQFLHRCLFSFIHRFYIAAF